MNSKPHIVILGTDLVHDSVLAMQGGAPASDLAHMIHAHLSQLPSPYEGEPPSRSASAVEG